MSEMFINIDTNFCEIYILFYFSNQYLMISSHITFYYQTVQLTEKAFKVQNPSVIYATCNFFSEFLK